MLYRPDWHEPLTDRRWDEAWIRDAVASLVADTVAAYDADDFWPAHEWDAWGSELPLKDVFVGAAGIAWGLARLDADVDAAAIATRTHERFRAHPTQFAGEAVPQQARSSLLNGETGIAFVAYSLAPSRELDDLLLELVRANLGNEANELMWGVAGTLLVARAMHARTGDTRWADAVRESENDLRAARDDDGYWTQQLHGSSFRSLGPVHGLVGNVAALGELGRTPEILRETAVRENGHVNWPPGPDDDKFRLQWCHGAPGIIATAAPYLDEELLVPAAQLIWDAGPPERSEKGAGLCHGTAGNGYALLKAFERTSDELWLARARAFAVHAVEQAQAAPRYSLFTGGIGAAVFAQDSLDARARFPIVDEAP